MYGVKADLSAFGKAIANGYVIAALVGRRDLISLLAPSGPVFYSGTFNGHPLSVAASMTTLSILERDRVTERLARLTKRLGDGINGPSKSWASTRSASTSGPSLPFTSIPER